VEAIAAQWRGVHELPERPSDIDVIDQVPHRTWRAPDGRALLEEYVVPGMGHGTPLKTRGAGAYGASAPYMLDVGISSTLRIAQFWEILGTSEPAAKPCPSSPSDAVSLPAHIEPDRLYGRLSEPEQASAATIIGKVIEDAFRAAGLMN